MATTITTTTTTAVTLVKEVQINERWFASKQSNGSLVLHNFPTDATLEDYEDVETTELHFSPDEAAHFLQLIGA